MMIVLKSNLTNSRVRHVLVVRPLVCLEWFFGSKIFFYHSWSTVDRLGGKLTRSNPPLVPGFSSFKPKYLIQIRIQIQIQIQPTCARLIQFLSPKVNDPLLKAALWFWLLRFCPVGGHFVFQQRDSSPANNCDTISVKIMIFSVVWKWKRRQKDENTHAGPMDQAYSMSV